MYLTDCDNQKQAESNFHSENYVPDHVLFRQINSETILILNGDQRHSANKIFRNGKGLHIAIRCNCGHNHPLILREGESKANWSVRLCDKTVRFLISKEKVYQDKLAKKIWIEMD